jgi:hypothetical protein
LSVVFQPDSLHAARLAEVTAEALSVAGKGNWPTGTPEAVHFTVRAIQAHRAGRKADCAEVDPSDGGLILHEVKTGVPTWSSMLDECRKDAWMLTDAGKAVHKQDGTGGRPNIKAVHWHFIAHDRFNSIGLADNVLECLKLNNIPFTIHPLG